MIRKNSGQDFRSIDWKVEIVANRFKIRWIWVSCKKIPINKGPSNLSGGYTPGPQPPPLSRNRVRLATVVWVPLPAPDIAFTFGFTRFWPATSPCPLIVKCYQTFWLYFSDLYHRACVTGHTSNILVFSAGRVRGMGALRFIRLRVAGGCRPLLLAARNQKQRYAWKPRPF